MAKHANPGKPNRNAKPGGELPYTNVADVLGGPPDNNPKPGLGADKGVVGLPKLPPVKK